MAENTSSRSRTRSKKRNSTPLINNANACHDTAARAATVAALAHALCERLHATGVGDGDGEALERAQGLSSILEREAEELRELSVFAAKCADDLVNS